LDEEDDPLHDSVSEFMSSLAHTTGVCNGQYIMRRPEGYVCHCTCGWHLIAADHDQGLRLAREHTGTPTG
jgi:hypothetical protein